MAVLLHGISKISLDNLNTISVVTLEIFPASHRDKIIEFRLLALHREQRLNNLVGMLITEICQHGDRIIDGIFSVAQSSKIHFSNLKLYVDLGQTKTFWKRKMFNICKVLSLRF